MQKQHIELEVLSGNQNKKIVILIHSEAPLQDKHLRDALKYLLDQVDKRINSKSPLEVVRPPLITP